MVGAVPRSNPDPVLAVRQSFLAAKMAEAEGRFQDSLAKFRSALDLQPQDPVLQFEFALLLHQLNVPDQARQHAERATALDPAFVPAWSLLGSIDLAGADKDASRAQPAAEELAHAYGLTPENSGLGLAYARALLLVDRPDEAWKVLDGISDRSGDPSYLRTLAQANDKRGADAAAGAAYEALIQADPDDRESLADAVEYYESRENFSRAIELLETLKKSSPDNPAIEDRIALDQMRAGRFDDAERALRAIGKVRPEDRAARRTLAAVLYQKGRADSAAEILRDLIAADPDDPSPVFTLALEQSADGKVDAAETALETFAKKLVGNASKDSLRRRIEGEIAALEYRVRDRAAARDRASKAAIASGDVAERALDVLLQDARDSGRPADGLEWARKAKDAEPKNPDYRADLAEFQIRSGDRPAGEKTLEDLASSGVAADVVAGVDAWMRLKEYGAAARVASAAAERFAGNADILFRLGAAQERAGHVADSEAAFRRVLAIRPNDASTLNYLGYMFADRSIRLEEARRLIQRALVLDPRNGAYLDSLGWACYRLNEVDEARRYLREAADRIPDDPTVQEHLGDVAARMGRRDEALVHWKKSLTLAPDEPAKIEAKIRALGTTP